MMPKRVQALWWAFVGLVLVAWWFWGTTWIETPRSYRGGVFFVACVMATLGFHLRALWRFQRMTALLKVEERQGLAAAGSHIFASNQRFRYVMRTVESLMVLAIGVFAIIAVAHPAIVLNKNYARLVVTYFVGSILLTGYLTYRDLRVIGIVRKLSNSDERDTGAATLTHVRDEVTKRTP